MVLAGEIWTDFCALSIVLSLNELTEAELISQSPIIWKETPDHGWWFDQYQPFAIFYKETNVVEVIVRLENELASRLRSSILLRVTEQDGKSEPKQVAVWASHNLAQSDFENDAKAVAHIAPLQSSHANLKNGIISTCP